MKENYRVVRSTYKGKHSFCVLNIDDGPDMTDSYVNCDSIEEIRSALKNMLECLEKPVMVEKREMVEM